MQRRCEQDIISWYFQVNYLEEQTSILTMQEAVLVECSCNSGLHAFASMLEDKQELAAEKAIDSSSLNWFFLSSPSPEENEEKQPLTSKEEEERRIAEMGRPILGEHTKLEVIIEESYEFKVQDGDV